MQYNTRVLTCTSHRHNLSWGHGTTSDPSISLTEQDRATLQQWARSGTTEQRLALRARIILAAAAGQASVTIAGRLGVRHWPR